MLPINDNSTDLARKSLGASYKSHDFLPRGRIAKHVQLVINYKLLVKLLVLRYKITPQASIRIKIV